MSLVGARAAYAVALACMASAVHARAHERRFSRSNSEKGNWSGEIRTSGLYVPNALYQVKLHFDFGPRLNSAVCRHRHRSSLTIQTSLLTTQTLRLTA